jgi:ubiquinol-cytochrome c reductase cytochrome b subunit
MDLKDEHALQQIKTKLGGSLKLRAGSKSIRYRLHHKKGFLDLLEKINGDIRNSTRKNQLIKVCNHLSINYREPSLLSKDNAWFAGFFDADGCIVISLQYKIPQLTISVSNKKPEDLIDFKRVFRGNIYYDKSSDTYKWSIQSQFDNLTFLEYIKQNPCRSSKKHLLYLIPRFYELYSLKAYKAQKDSLLFKAWLLFIEKWKERSL